MKIKELKDLSSDELIQKEKSLKQELFNLSFQRKHGLVEKPGLFRTLRRDIARILTLLKERENNGTTKRK